MYGWIGNLKEVSFQLRIERRKHSISRAGNETETPVQPQAFFRMTDIDVDIGMDGSGQNTWKGQS